MTKKESNKTKDGEKAKVQAVTPKLAVKQRSTIKSALAKKPKIPGFEPALLKLSGKLESERIQRRYEEKLQAARSRRWQALTLFIVAAIALTVGALLGLLAYLIAILLVLIAIAVAPWGLK